MNPKALCIGLFLIIALLLQLESPHQLSAQSGETTIAIIGDFGVDNQPQQDVADLVDSWSPEYIVTVGDNRNGFDDYRLAVGKYYCDYLHGAQPGPHCPTGGNAATNRFFPTVGNHDYSDGRGISEYLSYFDIPGKGAISSNTSGTELFYDFTLGPVHFVSVNSESLQSEHGDQAQWAKKQLEESTHPFQIVLSHRSPFTSVGHGTRGGQMRWPFEAWGADAVLSGDDHVYERLSIDNIPYVINGPGGAGLRSFGTADPASQVRFRDDYGAIKLVASYSSLQFTYYSRDGVAQDSFELPQQIPPCHTVSLAAVEDTWINSEARNANFDDDVLLHFDGSPDHATLLRWDLSSIPADSTLQSAPIITLDYVDSTTHVYDIFEMKRNWKTESVTWDEYKLNRAWLGGSGGLGDSGSMMGQSSGRSVLKENIALNEFGQRVVQGWIDGGVRNAGVIIANYESASNGGEIYHHPHLTFEYCWQETTNVQMNSAETTATTPSSTHLLGLLLITTALTLSVQLRKRSSIR